MSEAPPEPQPFELEESFGLQPPDEEAEQERPRRSKARRIVLLALLVVALAALGTLGYSGWLITSQKDVTLNTPAQIGDLTLNQTSDATDTAAYLQDALNAEISLKKGIGAVYQDKSGHSILLFGGTATIWSPDSQLSNAFNLIADQQGAVTGVHSIDAGKLGGTMKCGTTKSDSTTLTICGWADHGAIAVAMFPNEPESAAAPLVRQIRDAIQVRH